jgi:hypothetical protein
MRQNAHEHLVAALKIKLVVTVLEAVMGRSLAYVPIQAVST